MEKCYITFRSVTLAQRAESVLKREGYQCDLQRAPKWLGQRDCGYALRVRRELVGAALEALRRAQAPLGKIICPHRDGTGEEMIL